MPEPLIFLRIYKKTHLHKSLVRRFYTYAQLLILKLSKKRLKRKYEGIR